MRVEGYCPMGCGPTLHLTFTGIVECDNPACPIPRSVHRILANNETEHIVKIEDRGFTIEHPLRERLDEPLFNCALHLALRELEGPPVDIGVWRVRIVNTDTGADELVWTPTGGDDGTI